ncbi:hypothetical protein LJC46_03215 [Desulfovibrio sp. OttesenSCG-928-G15]|nr:hypothetical protein [Desulfovibrio sp. OttesenSCG-928-G15]
MYNDIRSSLVHQKYALELVNVYLQSQYNWMRVGDAVRVSRLESSIRRLITDVYESRVELKRLLGGRTVRDAVSGEPTELREPVLALAQRIEEAEQACLEDARRNSDLAEFMAEEDLRRISAAYGFVHPENTVAQRVQ